ncbi:purine and uridine phosphorylase [Trichoderma austrokoningii]
MPERRRLTHGEYTIGWVCALSIEQTAAIYMLDERHQNLPNPASDYNAYNLGRVGKHNVVIAGLPRGMADNNNAATVAAQMSSTFTNIRMTLMVGVGGGIPEKTRLGDVVISSPTDTNSGVIQWDKGKEGFNGFTRKGYLSSPPTAGLTALANFEADPETMLTMRNYLRGMRNIRGIDEHFIKPASLEDVLFESDYNHVSGTTDCSACEKTRIRRTLLSSDYPTVHYGLIASGNKKIEDAKLRDRLSKEYNNNLYCIEMEAAGLMNFHCIVIRGICDYADSHAGKKWQKYAAAVAAACAKTYLGVVQEYEIHRPQSVPAPMAPNIASHLRDNEKSRKSDVQYHNANSPSLTLTTFEGTTKSAPRMLGWQEASFYNNLPSNANSNLGGNHYESGWNRIIREEKDATEALANLLRDSTPLAHVEEEKDRPQTPPRSPKRDNHKQQLRRNTDTGTEQHLHPQTPPWSPHRDTDMGTKQPLQDDDDSVPPRIKKESRVHTFPSTDPAAFFDAIEEGNIAIIKRELKNGTSLEIVDEFGRTPLWRAVDIGERRVIQFLLDNGANVEAKNFRGQNILDWALKKGKRDIVDMVLPIVDA